MRIGIDARMFGPRVTGIGNYTQHLVTALLELATEHRFVLFAHPAHRTELPAHTTVQFHPVRAPWYGWQEQLVLPWQLLRAHCDVLHFPNFNVPVFYRGRFVVTVHDLTPLQFPGPNQKRWQYRRVAYKSVLRSALRHAGAIIAVSSRTAAEIAQFEPRAADRVTVVYPGISPVFRKPADYGRIKDKLAAIGVRQPYIFYTGVWRDHKNVSGLLQAFSLLRQQGRFDGLIVLGGDPAGADAKVAREIARLPHKSVVTPGFLKDDELVACFQGASLTVVPSFAEGFGLVSVESLACGTPVAASATTSIPEILGDT